jgi:D-alanyl-D-alanine carboxypeptidase
MAQLLHNTSRRVFGCLLFALFIAQPALAENQTADSYIVVDANAGKVLSALNPDDQLHPASMTKIMTLFMTFEALQQGRLTLRTPLTVSENAAAQAPSKLGLRPGSAITVENCILASVTLSANDCAMVLAENIGGSEERFAQLMTSRAHALGMTATHFNNPNGLPDEGQLTTARDMATLAEAMIQRFPKYYPYFATRSFTYAGISHANHNHLMSRYPGMDGIKTGYIRESGFNLTASAVRNGHRLIAVIFGGTSAVQRDNYMANLLDDGFRRIQGQPALTASLSSPQGGKTVAVAAIEPAPVPPEGPTSLSDLSDSQAASEAIAEEAGTIEASAPAAPGEMIGEGDMDLAEPVPATKPAIAKVAAPQGKAQKVVFTNTPQPRVKPTPASWSVQLGTFSRKSASEETLKKAVAKLPAALQDNVKEVSAVLHVRHKTVYKAELVGLDEMGAKKACAVLAHCLPVRPARA